MTPPAGLTREGERSAVSRFLWRVTLLALWSFVLWGTLLDVGVAVQVLTEGPLSVGRALFAAPATDVAWKWANRVAGLVAPLFWLLVIGTVLSRERERS